MSLSAAAIKYRPIVVTGVAMLMLWGVVSVLTMPRREDPEYTVRTCAVTTVWPGVPAEKVEELITKPLEEAIDRISDVDIVRSTTTVGLSTIYVDAEETISPERIDNVWDKVRAQVSRVAMPEAGIRPDINDEYGDTYVILFGIYQRPLPGEQAIRKGREYSLRQLDLFSEKVKDAMRLLPGVAKSEQYGVVEEAVYVQTDLANWSQLNLTTDKLQQLVQSRNIVATGGSIDTNVGRYTVKPGGELNAVNEINSIIAGTTGEGETKHPVYLKDLGLNVVRAYVDPPRIICRFGDERGSYPAVIVALSMKSGGGHRQNLRIGEGPRQRDAGMGTEPAPRHSRDTGFRPVGKR